MDIELQVIAARCYLCSTWKMIQTAEKTSKIWPVKIYSAL